MGHAPYLEGGVLLHVPKQLWLLGRRVVAHRALELLPWKEEEDKVRDAGWQPLHGEGPAHSGVPCQVGEQILGGDGEGCRVSCQPVGAGRSSPLKEESGQLGSGKL